MPLAGKLAKGIIYFRAMLIPGEGQIFCVIEFLVKPEISILPSKSGLAALFFKLSLKIAF